MKVILSAKSVYPFHPVGGVQKYVYYFAKHLKKKGVEVEIVAPLDRGDPRQEEYEGIKYTLINPAIYWYLEYPIGWLGVHLFSRALDEYLRDQDFDLLHAFDMTGYQYFKRSARKPGLAHIFTDNYLCNPISGKNFLNFFPTPGGNLENIKKEKVKLSPFSDEKLKKQYWAQYQFKIKPMYECFLKAESIVYEDVVVQNEVEDLFYLDHAKGSVIPVGVDVNFATEALNKIPVKRHDFAFGEKDLVLLTVNRLAADKGIDKIILALEKIIAQHPKTYLIMIGKGYQEQQLKDLIRAKGLTDRVLHYFDVPEEKLFMYYKVADVYISAFSYLGSSISTLEAMAAGLPIITTAQPWLVKNGENGVVLKNNDPDLIAKSVLELFNEGNLKEKGQSSKAIVKDFDWNNIADDAIKVYTKVLKARK